MTVWTAMGLLAAGTFALRAVGPAALTRLDVSSSVDDVVHLIPPALLAALIGVSTLAAARELVVDERAAGVAVAAVAAWRRLPLFVVIFAAVATTALLRTVV